MMDQNEEILRIINRRMALGRERYGHGVRVADDTRQWGTQADSWAEMALEEVLDGMIYMAAQLIRVMRAPVSEEALYGLVLPRCESLQAWNLHDLNIPVSQWHCAHNIIQQWNSRNSDYPGLWYLWPPSGAVTFVGSEQALLD